MLDFDIKRTPDKKIVLAIIVTIAGLLIFLLATLFVLLNRKGISYTPSNEKVVQESCLFISDQEAYVTAIESNSFDVCSCIQSEEFKTTCVNTISDQNIYIKALNELDETVCEKINDETSRESCVLAVADTLRNQDDITEEKNEEAFTGEKVMDIEILEETYENEPENLENLIELASAYASEAYATSLAGEVDMDTVNKTLEIIDEAKNIQEDEPRLLTTEGLLYTLTEQDNKALSAYTSCLNVDPENSEALFNRGVLYVKMNKKNEAIADFEKLTTLDVFLSDVAEYQLCKLYSGDKEMYSKATAVCTHLIENTENEALKIDTENILDSLNKE